MDKPFNQLSEDEANAIVDGIIRRARTDDQLRNELTAAGFDGGAAEIDSTSGNGHYMAMVMVWGPRGEVITGRRPRSA